MKLTFKVFNIEFSFNMKKHNKLKDKCVCMSDRTEEIYAAKRELLSKEWDTLSEGDKKLAIGLPVTLEELGL